MCWLLSYSFYQIKKKKSSSKSIFVIPNILGYLFSICLWTFKVMWKHNLTTDSDQHVILQLTSTNTGSCNFSTKRLLAFPSVAGLYFSLFQEATPLTHTRTHAQPCTLMRAHSQVSGGCGSLISTDTCWQRLIWKNWKKWINMQIHPL